MRPLKSLFLAIVIFVSFSCQEKVLDEKSVEFPTTIVLEGKTTGIQVLGIPKVSTYKGNLIVLNRKDSLLFRVYDSDFEFLNGFGQLEEFPLELKFPMFSSQVISEEEDYVPIFDLENLNSIKLWPNLTKVAEPWKHEKFKLKNLDFYPITLIYTTDTTALYVPEMGGAIVIDFFDNNKVYIKPYQFKGFEKIKPLNYSSVFQSVAAANLKKGIILIAPILTGELEFYDLQGEFIKSVIYDTSNLEGDMLSEENYLNTDIIINAIDLSITENFIYLLSSNNKLNQHKTGIKTNNSSIYKFDWEGQIIQKYDLGVDASSFGVDESRNRFYATVVENDDEPIWYFEF